MKYNPFINIQYSSFCLSGHPRYIREDTFQGLRVLPQLNRLLQVPGQPGPVSYFRLVSTLRTLYSGTTHVVTPYDFGMSPRGEIGRVCQVKRELFLRYFWIKRRSDNL